MLRIENLVLPNKKVVNFSLGKGEGVALYGPNGCGKSLMLKSIARLVSATFEKFEYEGKNVELYEINKFRSEVLYVPTSSYYLDNMKVQDFFSLVHKFSVYKNFKSYFDYLSFLKKWGIENTEMSKLSSGQRQLISILRAMTLKSKVLLLDEPTSNLDQEKTLEVEERILDWKSKQQTSIVLITHDPEQIKRLQLRKIIF